MPWARRPKADAASPATMATTGASSEILSIDCHHDPGKHKTPERKGDRREDQALDEEFARVSAIERDRIREASKEGEYAYARSRR